jgi:hypothetical protein
MSYGVKIWGPNGELWMDSNTITWNLVGWYEIPANYAISGSWPQLSGAEFIALQIPLEVPEVQGYTYEKTVSVSGSTVSVWGGNQDAAVVVLCR